MKKKHRIAKRITKARLDEYLGLVGWTTRFHGANTWRLYNPYGGCSLFQFTADREKPDELIYSITIDEYSNQRAFGEVPKEFSYVHGGFMSFILRGCTLEAYSDNDGETWEFVSITPIAKDKKNASFLCFQNWSDVIPEGTTIEDKE